MQYQTVRLSYYRIQNTVVTPTDESKKKRREQKFENKDLLVAQLGKDKIAALKILNKMREII